MDSFCKALFDFMHVLLILNGGPLLPLNAGGIPWVENILSILSMIEVAEVKITLTSGNHKKYVQYALKKNSREIPT